MGVGMVVRMRSSCYIEVHYPKGQYGTLIGLPEAGCGRGTGDGLEPERNETREGERKKPNDQRLYQLG